MEGSGATVPRGSDGMAVKRMVTVFGSRLCAFSVAGDEIFEEVSGSVCILARRQFTSTRLNVIDIIILFSKLDFGFGRNRQ